MKKPLSLLLFMLFISACSKDSDTPGTCNSAPNGKLMVR